MEHRLLQRERISADIIALTDEGYRLWRDGRLGEARLCLEAALVRAARGECTGGVLSARHLLGNVAFDQGDLAGAQEHHLFVLAESERLGLGVGVASALHNLGLITASTGDIATARYQLLAADHRYRRLGMPEAAALVRANLARIEGQGEP